MHAVVELDGGETGPSVGPQRTPDIDDVIVQDTSAEAVGKFGGHPPQPGILPALPNATDHIVVVEHLHHARDIAGVVLEIGIEGDHESPAYLLKAGIQRRTLPSVVSEADQTHLSLLSREFVYHLRRVVFTAIIHEEEFV